jgi:hypothetical protein
MPRRSWAGVLGLVLLAPAAVYWTWLWISDPVRPADVRLAFERLATVSLNQAQSEGTLNLTATTPNDASWRRIIRNWGNPGYIIGVVSPGPSHYMYCLKDFDVRVQVRIGDELASLKTAEYAPYGYSVDCTPAGLQFRARPGTAVQIHLEAALHSHRPVDLIVEPYWTVGTKDRLVGISIQEDLHLRALANASGIAGIIAISFAALLLSRRPVRPAR